MAFKACVELSWLKVLSGILSGSTYEHSKVVC